MKTLKLAVTAVAVLALLWFIASSLVTTIPPSPMTSTAIGESFARIQLYAKQHRRLPSTIADFPRRDGYANRTDDGWGHPLAYAVDANGIVTLSSLGADNQVGGLGDDADISRSYASIDQQGRFIAGNELWLVDGEISAR